MRFQLPDVRIADVETCDFALTESLGTADLLQRARPEDADHLQRSPTGRKFLAELGVDHRELTYVPGSAPRADRRTAFDLARSAVERLAERRLGQLARLDALLFVSTSNPYPCNSQAALLAREFGWSPSCFDLKAGCSGGILGLLQGAQLIQSGAQRVLVVMAENLSHLTPADDLRMLLTVGDGAAAVLLERAPGRGFRAALHGSAPEHAAAMTVRQTFPPPAKQGPYAFAFSDAATVAPFLHRRWRELFHESLAESGLRADDLARCFLHQTHRGQIDGLVADLALDPARVPEVVGRFGNMGTPTFAVAMAHDFSTLHPGDQYLIQGVGGGVSWCSIVAEHA